MNYIEYQEESLKNRIISQNKNSDFEDFWASQLAGLRAIPLSFKRESQTCDRLRKYLELNLTVKKIFFFLIIRSQ